MDIQKYIASGILEQYVLGNLTAVECGEVEQYALEYPEIGKEIEAIEEALELYAQANAVQPPADLEPSILDKLKDKIPQSAAMPQKAEGRLIKLPTVLAIAASLAALVWGISQYQQRSETEGELAELQTQYEQLQTNCTEQLQQKEKLEAWFAFLKDKNTSAVEMKGLPDKQQGAVAIVYQNDNQNKSYLEVVDMPEVPAGKQYQLWAIVDGQPVDMGVFDVAITPDTAFLEVPFIANVQAYAVTVEKTGGSPAPTLEEMVVIGNAG